MILSKHRFHGHNSLSYVYRNGETVRGPLTAIKFIRNDRRDAYRLAVVVSKKVSKLAVTRNRIRRRLYEAVRRIDEKIDQPYDMIVTVFADKVATISAEEVDRLVYAQLKQAGIIK